MSCLPSSFFIATSQFDWPITQKKRATEAPKIEGSILKWRVPALWPIYIGERRTTFVKAYGIKVRCYGEHVGEHIENLRNPLGTLREHMGTH
jgi:hypothetical protein